MAPPRTGGPQGPTQHRERGRWRRMLENRVEAQGRRARDSARVGRQAGGGRSYSPWGCALTGATHWGTLNAVTDLGIAASLSPDAARPGAEGEQEARERFYPWSAVLCIDLAADTTRGVGAADSPGPLP